MMAIQSISMPWPRKLLNAASSDLWINLVQQLVYFRPLELIKKIYKYNIIIYDMLLVFPPIANR